MELKHRGWLTKKKVKRLILFSIEALLIITMITILSSDSCSVTLYSKCDDRPWWFQVAGISIAQIAWLVIILKHFGTGERIDRAITRIERWWNSLPDNGEQK